jgi:hypothetical protein
LNATGPLEDDLAGATQRLFDEQKRLPFGDVPIPIFRSNPCQHNRLQIPM